jgi:flagellar motor switch/type III secretory pathway protein FliN
MRIDDAHRSPIAAAAGLHQRADQPQQEPAPTPFAWQDLNLSAEKIDVEVRLGSRGLSARELESLKSGQVIGLESSLEEPVEIRMDREVMAYGQIVIVDSKLAIQITELRQSPRRRAV